MKTIHTLVQDIEEVIMKKGGWDNTVSSHLASRLADTIDKRLSPSEEQRRGSLRMSNLGKPCTRQLWYEINSEEEGEPLEAAQHFKFLFGDILEDLLISLAKAAGHKVEGEQDTLSIDGIKGHRDCVIDGVTVDVKSASSFSYQKFRDHKLRDNDPFGYIEQLSSYVYAAKDDPLVEDKVNGAFLVVDKQHGHICLDMYDFTKELALKKQKVDKVREQANGDSPPPRAFEPEHETHYRKRTGNKKLPLNCSYCAFKHQCHDNLKTYIHSGKPIFYTEINGNPKGKKT